MDLVGTSLGLLRSRWPALLAVAVLALGPALAATSLIEIFAGSADAIVNGSVAPKGSWTQLALSGDVGGAQVRLTVPVLPALAWFVGLGVGLRVLAGAPVREAWLARLGWWLALGAILATLTALSFLASVVLSGFADGVLSVLTVLLCAYGLARLALAMPAMLVDGFDLPGSLRHAVRATHGRTLGVGTALILLALVPPLVLVTLVNSLTLPRGGSWVADVLWVGVAGLLEYLVLLLAFPLQVATLLGAYRYATLSIPDPEPAGGEGATDGEPAGGVDGTDREPAGGVDDREPYGWPGAQPVRPGDDELELTVTIEGSTALPRRRERPVTEPAPKPRSPRWLQIAGVALLAVLAPAVGPVAVLANPSGLPVLTIARPEAGFSTRPLAMAVLDDGTVAFVDSMQAALCRDRHCTELDLMTMPCYDGEAPEPAGAPVSNCASEGPLLGAEITPDGTLLAVTHGRAQGVRLFWCRLDPAPDGQCRWGGANVLYRQPDLWQYWSMDVAALPGGGFAVVMVAPGPNDETLTLRLALCERLDCPTPTVHSRLTVPRTNESGRVAVAADPGTGTVALGYFDLTNRSVWLGGCPAGCPEGPVVNQVYSPGSWAINRAPTLRVGATPAGPTAVLNLLLAEGGSTGIAMTCDDPACSTVVSLQELEAYATLALDRAGTPYLAGGSDTSPLFGSAPAGGFSSLAGTGEVVAAACGPEGDLVLLLDDGQPNLALVTYAGPYCSGGVSR